MIFGQSVTEQALKDYMLIGFAFLTGKPDKKLDKLQHTYPVKAISFLRSTIWDYQVTFENPYVYIDMCHGQTVSLQKLPFCFCVW